MQLQLNRRSLWFCLSATLCLAVSPLAGQAQQVQATNDDFNSVFSVGIGGKGDTATNAVVDSTGTLTMSGAEGEIWGAKDGFNYVCQPLSYDGEAAIKFLGVNPTNETGKAGLMIRETLDEGSRYVLIAWTINGLAFLSRDQMGAASQMTKLSAGAVPLWLKLSRKGDWFGAYTSKDGVNWTLAEWRVLKMSQHVYVGLAAGGIDGPFLSQFKNLQVGASNAANLPTIGTGNGLLGEYFSNPTLTGSPVFSKVDPTVDFDWGLGAPLGLHQRDNFAVRWTGQIEGQYSETYTISIASDDGARVWLDGNLVIDAWDDRPLAESTCQTALAPGQKHAIKIEYYENKETAAVRLMWSSPSTPKRVIPQSQLYPITQDLQTAVNVRTNAFAGLAASDTNTTPALWQSADIGSAASGVMAETNRVKFIRGFGARIGGMADEFHYLYQPLHGNGEMVIRMLNVEGGQPWAKAGLMIRESLDADSTYASILGTVGYGLIFNYRAVQGRFTMDSTDKHFDIPYWLKIVRYGNLFSGYVSTNGVDWRLVERMSIPMKQDAYIGFAICSRSDKADCRAWFDSEAILPAEPPEQFPITGTGDGIKVEYFDNPDLIGQPGFSEVQDRMDFEWMGRLPVPNATGTRFSGRWTAELQARYTEPYTLVLYSLYGARVWLNETLIMDTKGHPQRENIVATMDMVAGQKYLLRIECYDCADDAQGRFKWQSPSTALRTVAQSQLYSHPTDTDGDGIPDIWEIAHGLNPNDPSDANEDPDHDGLTNLQEYHYYTNPKVADTDGDGLLDGFEIAHGLNPRDPSDANQDPDHDGLTNLQEYQAGTDPHDADSDHDGLDDGLEVQIGTNPLQSDIQNIQTVQQINGAEAVDHLGQWDTDGTTYKATSRGWAEYTVHIAEADCYRLEIAGLAVNPADNDHTFELQTFVDGEDLGRTILTADTTTPGTISRMLPWLQPGDHRIRVFWDNAVYQRTFKLVSLKLQQLQGPDANQNGVKDWVDRRLLTAYGVDSATNLTGHVSPAFIEGQGRYLSMMRFSGDVRPQPGTDGRWFANVPLSPTGALAFVASFENGGIIFTNWIAWSPLNILTAQDITIRQGDSLLLTVQTPNVAAGQMQIQIADLTNCTAVAGQAIPYRFSQAGDYVVTGSLTGGSSPKSITVHVWPASPDTESAAWLNKPRNWEYPGASGVSLQPDPRVDLVSPTNGSAYSLTIHQPENAPILARVGSSGSVLNTDTVEGFRLWSGFETGLRVLSTDPDGTQLIEMGLIMSPLRTNVTVNIEVHAAGVLFDDGTIQRILTTQDFDALGQASVRFLRPASAQTSACHRLKVYQGSTLLGVYP